MLALRFDVVDNVWDQRFGNGKRAVPVLPGEIPKLRKFPMNPERRIAFKEFGDVAGREDRRYAEETMNMIIDAADLQGDHFMFACNAADPCPDIFFDVDVDKVG